MIFWRTKIEQGEGQLYTKVALEEQLDEFLKLLSGEESEIVTPQYGREVIRVLEEAFEQM